MSKTPDPNREPGIRVEQVLLLSASFSHRGDVLSVDPSVAAQDVDLQVGLAVQDLTRTDGTRAAAVIVGVKTRDGQSHPYVFDVQVMAIVGEATASPNIDPLEYVLTAGATMLFPFLREAVANITGRGRIGPIWLRPYNVQKAVAELRAQMSAKPRVKGKQERGTKTAG